MELPAGGSQSVAFRFGPGEEAKSLSVASADGGTAFLHVDVAARPDLSKPFEPRDRGFRLRRQYYKVEGDGSLAPPENLEVGDLIAVSLDITVPKESRYVAVDDPLPAICEAVNPNFQSMGSKAVATGGNPRWQWWSPTFQELRADRALFFRDYVWGGGDFRVEYLARVIAPGSVIAAPAKVEAMYDPETYGLSGATQLRCGKPAVQAGVGQ
ncbi:MAG: hypothetical protein R3F11_32535 [Verrucomicrobiales bacterium]